MLVTRWQVPAPVRCHSSWVLTLSVRLALVDAAPDEIVGGWVYSVPVFEYSSRVRTRGRGVRGIAPSRIGHSRVWFGRSALPAAHPTPGRRAATGPWSGEVWGSAPPGRTGHRRPYARRCDLPPQRPMARDGGRHLPAQARRSETDDGNDLGARVHDRSPGGVDLGPPAGRAWTQVATIRPRSRRPGADQARSRCRRTCCRTAARPSCSPSPGRGWPRRRRPRPTGCATRPRTWPRCGPRRRCSPPGPGRSRAGATG